MTISQIIERANAEIGIKENPPSSNNVKYNTWYYGHEVNGSAYPWCATFISWLYRDTSIVKKTASCMDMAQSFKNANRWYSVPQIGDIVFYKFGTNNRWTNHVGLVIDINKDSITTIEGNTSNSSKGSQDNGGCVAKRVRKANIVGYGRPNYYGNDSCYPKYNGKNDGVDNVLRSIGVPEKYLGNWQKRKPIALNCGIVGYTGTKDQNELIIVKAFDGAIKRV